MQAAETLDLPEVYVVAHLAALWTWALDNAPDGLLPRSPRIIAKAAQWPGEPNMLINALFNAGFLVLGDDSETLIHDWDNYAGKLVAHRKANADKQKAWRDRQKGNVTEAAPRDDTPVTVTLPTTLPLCDGATVPNPTQPNPTQPEEDPQEPKKVPAPPKVDRAKLLALFGVFYAEYPNKQSRPDAEKGWLKLNPSEALYSEIMAGLAKAKRSEEWHEEGGKYIPYPASFLSRRRWEDTYAPLGSRPLPRTSPPVIGGTLANPDFVQEKFPAGFRPHTREEAIEADRVYYRNQQILKEGATGNAH